MSSNTLPPSFKVCVPPVRYGPGVDLPTLFATTLFLKWIKPVSAVVVPLIARTQIRWLHVASGRNGLS
jgi:hypothetical protein